MFFSKVAYMFNLCQRYSMDSGKRINSSMCFSSTCLRISCAIHCS
ncbi:MAG: hypothetical protein LDL53_00365 [Candidatus Hydrogenedens sp.]|nr:hypothetical protein [Candidatus Hydrogenedens sp.]